MSSISELAPGLSAVIADIASPPDRRDRLAAFGLVRGTTIRLLQIRPAVVLSVDNTELALDPRIASEIIVH